MTKPFIILLVLCVLALGVFIYFIFGFNQKTSSSSQQTSNLPTTTTPAVTAAAVTDLKVEDITVGTGPEVKNGDTVVINYTGTLTSGTKFDSSYDRHEPFETQIG